MSPADVTLEKTMPSSLESERAVLGAVLLDDRAIFPATESLTVEDFYLESHREIFRAMLALSEEDTSIDIFTLREELRRRNKEAAAGGHAVDVRTDGEFSLSKPRLLFSAPMSPIARNMRCWDISVDGQRFLMLKEEERKPQPVTELILVQNRFEELKRLCPTSGK